MSESLNDKLEAFFRSMPNIWIDGMQLSKVAGSYAWRSRCADLRRRGMQIDNRQRRMVNAQGKKYTVSEYRFTYRASSLLDMIELGI
jgi:hypothetical protein